MDPPVVPARASTAGSVSTRRRNERSPPALSRSTRVPSGTSATPRSPRVRSASRVACGSARRPRRTRPPPRSSSAERARGSATASQSATSRTSNTAATERSRSTIRRRRARRSRRSAASQASAPGTDVYRSRRYSRSGRPASIYSAGRVPLDEASYPPGESPSDARRELLGIVRGMESPDDRSEAEL